MTARRSSVARARSNPGFAGNPLERAYSQYLALLQLAGEVAWWRFEAVRLQVGVGAWYCPDFMVCTLPAGELEFHETKGTWASKGQQAARVRLKAAAGLFPGFRFVAVGWKHEKWVFEEFTPGG